MNTPERGGLFVRPRSAGWRRFAGRVLGGVGLLCAGWMQPLFAAVEYPTYTQGQLDADLEQMRRTIENFHPRLYTAWPDWQATYSHERSTLRDGMTELEFFRMVSRLVSLLDCGHSGASLSTVSDGVAATAERRYVPLLAKVVDGALWVDRSLDSVALPPGSEIREINGRTGANILQTFYDHLTADGTNETFKDARINGQFGPFFYLYVDDAETFQVRLRNSDGDESEVEVTGVDPDAWSTLRIPRPQDNVPVGLYEFTGERAYLLVKSFNFYSASAHVVFETFVDGFFSEAASRGIQELILDVRGNGGGDPYMGDYLLSYLTDAPYTYFRRESDFYADLEVPSQPKANAFTGRLLTLMDGGCFSTNGHFLSLLKTLGIGEMIGEESGGSFATTANNSTLTLSNSRLRFSYSRNTFTTTAEDLAPGRGVFPDYPVKPTIADYVADRDAIRAFAQALLGADAGPTEEAIVIVGEPRSQEISPGQPVSLVAEIEGGGGQTYQWRHDGEQVPGATSAMLTIAAFGEADVGDYDVVVTNSINQVTSATARLEIGDGQRSRLVNLSARTTAGGASDVAIAGFVITGNEPRHMLVRGVGPALAELGVAGVLSEPTLTLYRGDEVVATNQGWSAGPATTAAAISEQSIRVGAFALPQDSRDAALLLMLEPGLYSAHLASGDDMLGTGLVEVYGPAAGGIRALGNISTRARVDGGELTLVSGFVVEGVSPQTLLIRAVGPGLAELGVTGALARPRLSLFVGKQEVASNTGWMLADNSSDIETAAADVGAFALAPENADAAMLITLQPGTYTAVAEPAENGEGVVLIEVYAVESAP